MLDYYQILEVSETATTDEIKKSFRRLAIKYHPDKNPNNKNAESKFKLVAEAYETLSDIDTKRTYDFKRGQTTKTNSNYSRHENKKSEPKEEEIKVTPTIILGIFTEIRRKIISLDKDSINTFALYKSLNELLSDINIHFLIASDEITINNKIIDEVCICCRYLEYSSIETIIPKLVRLAGTDNDSLVKIYSLNKLKKKVAPRSTSKEKVASNDSSSDSSFWGLFIFAIIAFIIFIYYLSDNNSSSNSTTDNSSTNNSNTQNNNDTSKVNWHFEPVAPSKYKGNQLKNGSSPLDKCFGKPIYAGNPTLTIKNGSSSDAIVCLYSVDRNRTIRNEYIRASSNFKISQIPQGNYKIRIFSGNDWNPNLTNSCGKKGNFETDISFYEFDGTDYFQDNGGRFTNATVTLYSVEGGNASSSPINQATFFSK